MKAKIIIQSIFKTFFLSLCLIGQVHFAYAVDQSLIPPAKTTFLDANGKPLSSGKVYFYVPSTTTPKATYQNIGGTILNSQPVTLDAAGRALIWGTGSYRQIVKDKNGNTIWDQTTSAAGSGTTPTNPDTLAVGSIVQYAGFTAPSDYAFAYGQEVSRTTYSLLYAAITSSQPVFCSSGSPTLTGLTDTTNFWIGMALEIACVASGNTTIISKTSTTVTMAVNANTTSNPTAIFYPWGRGNGTTTFNLPDLRGVAPIGNNNMGGVASSNLDTTYFGATDPNSIGALGGNKSTTLVTGNLPPYTPSGTVNTSTDSGDTVQTNANVTLQTSGLTAGSSIFGWATVPTVKNMGTIFNGHLNSTFAGNAQGGTSTPFSRVQPSKTINYIIKILPGSGGGGGGGATTCAGLSDAGTACTANTGTSGNNLPFLDGVNTWSGRQVFPAAGASLAGLNITPGSTPASPSNGDMWVTSSGLFVRINGSTVGPLGTGGGGGSGVTSIGGQTGAITLSGPISMVGSTLTATSNVPSIGGNTGNAISLSNLSMVGNTLTAGTIATQAANSVAITGGSITGTTINSTGATITNVPTPTNSGDAANKSYVDNVAGAGINPLAQSRLATATVLPNTPTYSNGASGVGATLTAGVNSSLTVDGVTANLNDVVLVKNQVSAFQNGVYTVTTAGSGAAPWVLTRATYFDTAAEMKNNSLTAVTAGTANAATTWIMSPAVATVGTDSSTWSLYTASGVSTIAGVSGALTLASGLSMVGSQLTPAANVSSIGGVSGAITLSGASMVGSQLTITGGVTSIGGMTGAITCGSNITCTSSTISTIGTPCTMTAVSADTTLSSTVVCQTILVDASGGARTITLFTAGAGVAGYTVHVKKIDSTANNVIVAVSGGGNIDSSTSVSTSTRNASFTFQPNSSQWWQL